MPDCLGIVTLPTLLGMFLIAVEGRFLLSEYWPTSTPNHYTLPYNRSPFPARKKITPPSILLFLHMDKILTPGKKRLRLSGIGGRKFIPKKISAMNFLMKASLNFIK